MAPATPLLLLPGVRPGVPPGAAAAATLLRGSAAPCNDCRCGDDAAGAMRPRPWLPVLLVVRGDGAAEAKSRMAMPPASDDRCDKLPTDPRAGATAEPSPLLALECRRGGSSGVAGRTAAPMGSRAAREAPPAMATGLPCTAVASGRVGVASPGVGGFDTLGWRSKGGVDAPLAPLRGALPTALPCGPSAVAGRRGNKRRDERASCAPRALKGDDALFPAPPGSASAV